METAEIEPNRHPDNMDTMACPLGVRINRVPPYIVSFSVDDSMYLVLLRIAQLS